jgi:hypothetical protein
MAYNILWFFSQIRKMKRTDEFTSPDPKKTKLPQGIHPDSPEEENDAPTKTAWEHAKEWVNQGKIVFPLTKQSIPPNDKDGKSPCVGKWQETTLEESKKNLEKSYELLTGERNGLYVLDLDLASPDQNKFSGVDYIMKFMKNNGIQCNYMVRTGSGGLHLYFKWDAKIYLPPVCWS